MITNKKFLSVDWGTTNFRLRLVDRESENILIDYKSDDGILKTYDDFVNQITLGQQEYFINHLRAIILNIPHDVMQHPILLSGMASSSIGLKELPYAEFPFDKSGESLIFEKLHLDNELNIILVSGVKSNTGMMRGEEIQAIGLAEFMKDDKRGVLVLPGTHSKHMIYENGIFTELRNYMTGELFDVLTQNSILAKSVEKSNFDDKVKSHFLRGLDIGGQGDLSAHLLSVRANDVIHKIAASHNYHFLSGVIIGAELKDIISSEDYVYLAANEPLFSIYKTALTHIGNGGKLSFFDGDVSDQALIKGQLKILRKYESG
jgi:2-dehydro-3-deoxygalactonokinase